MPSMGLKGTPLCFRQQDEDFSADWPFFFFGSGVSVVEILILVCRGYIRVCMAQQSDSILNPNHRPPPRIGRNFESHPPKASNLADPLSIKAPHRLDIPYLV